MIMKEEFLKKIRSAFNLNIYEAKIWTALLSKGVAAAGEISDISNVPRSRTYDVLETLEKRGFIIMKLGKPIKYLAISPEDILKRLRKRIEKESFSKLENLDNVKQTELFNEIQLLHKNGIENVKVEEISASIRGRNNLYDHLETLLKNAKKSVMIVTTANGLIRKADALKHVLKKLSQNKVEIKIATKTSPQALDTIKELSGFAEIREIKNIDARFVIIDGKDIVFSVTDDKINEDDQAIWVSTPFFASAMEKMFEDIWKNLSEVKV
mgnify:CR=1 FL=1